MRVKLTSLSDLAGTGVLIAESGDEKDRITAGVELVVDRALREKGALTRGQGIFDKAGAVLFDKAGFHLSGYEIEELSCPGVGVWSVHTAWPGSVS